MSVWYWRHSPWRPVHKNKGFVTLSTIPRYLWLVMAALMMLPACALITDNIVDGRSGTVVPPTSSYRPPPPRQRPETPDLSEFPHRGRTAAVLTFDTRAGISPDEVALLADRFAVELGQLNAYRLISRSKMKELLELQDYSTACSSTECVIEAGQHLGVEYMIHGSIGRIGSIFTVNVYVTSVERAAVVAGATVDCSGQIEGLLTEGMVQAVNSLLRAVIDKVEDPNS